MVTVKSRWDLHMATMKHDKTRKGDYEHMQGVVAISEAIST
jgi:hypothetical protein